MIELTLTAEQEAQAQRIADRVAERVREETLNMARIFASKPDHELLGATEFVVRDRAHAIAAEATQAALNERKKGGTKVRA